MAKDIIVIDIETKNSFADVGGQGNLKDLDCSLIGLYSYNFDKYMAFREDKINEVGPILQNAGLIIGFSITRFDLPVLNKYYNFNLLSLPRVDLLDEIETAYGRRIGLDLLAKANLGYGKTGHGLDAIEYYKKGDWDSLEKYCLMDVKVTRLVYEYACLHGKVKYQDRTGKCVEIPLAIAPPSSVRPALNLSLPL